MQGVLGKVVEYVAFLEILSELLTALHRGVLACLMNLAVVRAEPLVGLMVVVHDGVTVMQDGIVVDDEANPEHLVSFLALAVDLPDWQRCTAETVSTEVLVLGVDVVEPLAVIGADDYDVYGRPDRIVLVRILVIVREPQLDEPVVLDLKRMRDLIDHVVLVEGLEHSGNLRFGPDSKVLRLE